MKKIIDVLLCVIFLMTSFIVYGQAPESFSYQAVVRDTDNKLAVNRTIGAQISILSGRENGAVMYRETHSTVTNGNGLMTIRIGQGNAITGVFSSIDWSLGTYFVKSEIDLSGGNNYSIVSTTQLLSVPYALHAKSAEKLATSISYNDLSDLPEGTGFSGDYEHLTNKPELFDGKYSSLTETPELFSGDYEDLTNLPELFDGKYSSLSQTPELFSGDYQDLTNRPQFKDSIERYGFSGNYNDLTDRPIATFIVNYNDLEDKPVFKDSIDYYGFSGDYNELINKPDFFSGDYMDLTNKPDIKDSISQYGFDGNYQKLTQKPAFKDSIDYYGFSGNYEDLVNVPLATIKDSVEKYGFDGNYKSLAQKPVFKDSIYYYGFDGNYHSLIQKPVFKDSINQYGFSGNYDDLNNIPAVFDGDYNQLSNRPVGSKTGDILYWEEVEWDEEEEGEEEVSGWRLLPRGSYGMVLTIDEEGKPAWVNITHLMSFIADAEYDTIYASCGDNGRISPSGKVAVIKEGIAQFTITPNGGYGIDTIYVDSVALNLGNIDRTQPYSYTFSSVDTTHYIHAVFAQKSVEFSIDYYGISSSDVAVVVNEENVVGTGTYYTAAGGNISFEIGLAARIGVTIELDGDDITKQVIANGYSYNITVGTDNRKVDITFYKTDKTYAVGDIYPNETSPEGVVILVESGGEKGIILHLQEGRAAWSVHDDILVGASDEWDGEDNRSKITDLEDYPVFENLKDYGTGWYLPAINELQAVSTNFTIINTALSKISSAIMLSSEEEYWSSTEISDDYSWGVLMDKGVERFYKKNQMNFRAVKIFE